MQHPYRVRGPVQISNCSWKVLGIEQDGEPISLGSSPKVGRSLGAHRNTFLCARMMAGQVPLSPSLEGLSYPVSNRVGNRHNEACD